MPEPFVVEVAMRWGDQDMLGHVNNVQIARILEESRVRTMQAWFGDHPPFAFVLARQEIEFTSILHYSEDPTRVQIWVPRIGNSSFDYGYRLFAPTGELAALGETTVTALDLKTGQPLPLPDSVRVALAERSGDEVPLRRRR